MTLRAADSMGQRRVSRFWLQSRREGGKEDGEGRAIRGGLPESKRGKV